MNRFNFLLFLCISVTGFAQDLTISGQVVDSNNTPIAYANAILYNVDASEIISGSSTDDAGQYNITSLQSGSYTLKVTYVGCDSKSQNITLDSSQSVATIILSPSTETLGEVTVNVKKPTFTKQVDRLVFNVENTALIEGTVLDVLKSTPGVLVMNDDIMVKNTNPTIYINDRKVNLSASELSTLLDNSSANSIQKVEVITNPPAKYDASSGVVLKIIMGKNLIMGYRGVVNTSYTQGVFPRYTGGLSQFYKTNKLNINLNYNYKHSKVNRNNIEEITYQNNDIFSQFWKTDSNRNTTSKTHNANLNFDYFIDDNNTLSLTSNVLNLPYFDYNTKGNTVVNDLQGTDNYNFRSHNSSQDDKYNIGTDLDYKLKFTDQSKLSINAHYTTYDYQRNQHVNSDYYFQDPTSDFSTGFKTLNNQTTEILSSKLDYDLALDDSANLAMGIKMSNIKTYSDITQFDIDQTTGNQTLNTANTNAFDYDESVFAGYISYDKSWDKWSVSGGLRLEQTNIEGFSPETNTTNIQDYLEWFPKFNISWEAFDKASLHASFSRFIQRPKYTNLNPFNFFLNDNTIVTGNPDLRPSFTTYSTIGTTINNSFTIEAYYKTISNQIVELPIQDNAANLFVFSPTNIKSINEYGLDFLADLYISNKYSVYFLNSIYNHDLDVNYNNQTYNFNQWINYSELSSSFSMLKDNSLSVNLSLAYSTKFLQGTVYGDSFLFSNLSLSKKVLNNKGSVSLMFSDIPNLQDIGSRSRFANQNNYVFHDLDTRYVKLGFSYKFGNTTLQTNQNTKSHTERNRLK